MLLNSQHHSWSPHQSQSISNNFSNIKPRHGAQGTYDTASKSSLSSEFNSEDHDEVIKKILEEGSLQVSEVRFSHTRQTDDYKYANVYLLVDARSSRCQERVHGLHASSLRNEYQAFKCEHLAKGFALGTWAVCILWRNWAIRSGGIKLASS